MSRSTTVNIILFVSCGPFIELTRAPWDGSLLCLVLTTTDIKGEGGGFVQHGRGAGELPRIGAPVLLPSHQVVLRQNRESDIMDGAWIASSPPFPLTIRSTKSKT